MTIDIRVGDALTELRKLEAESVHCCVTSPPYWGLRDYGVPPLIWGGNESCSHEWGQPVIDRSRATPGIEGSGLTNSGASAIESNRFEKRSNFCSLCGAWRGQLGLEPTPDLYVAHLVTIIAEVRRVLKADGTLWLNIGDCYATGAGKVGDHPGGGAQGARWRGAGSKVDTPKRGAAGSHKSRHYGEGRPAVGPLTQPNRLPIEGLKPKDLVGIPWMLAKPGSARGCPEGSGSNVCGSIPWEGSTRNKRTVWTVSTQPFREAHFATFPPKLIEPCILAGSARGGAVLDPFAGAGTTGLVAHRHGRSFVGIELNPKYAEMARRRIRDDAPLFHDPEAA